MTKSLEDLASALALGDRKTVFLAGSHPSSEHPSYLPLAGDVLSWAIDALAPRGADKDLSRILAERCLPEKFYGSAVDLLGDHLLDLWSVLHYAPGERRNVESGFGPTAFHHAIVCLAAQNGTPILTPNFDCLFEMAAAAQGREMTVVQPDEFETTACDGFSLWKIHGSVGGMVRSLLSQISRANTPMLTRLRGLLAGTRLVIVGYSGRDIDLFPYLVSWSEPQEVWWIDPCINDPNHLASAFGPVSGKRLFAVPARTHDFVTALGSAGLLCQEAQEIHQVAPRNPAPEREAELVRHRQKVADVLSQHNGSEEELKLLRATALTQVGLNQAALQQLEAIEPTEIGASYSRFRYWICKAQVLHELARYTDSRECARAGTREANRGRLGACVVEAWAARVEARRMETVANYPSGYYSSSVIDLALLSLDFVWSSIAMRWKLRRVRPRSATYAQILAVSAQIEHLIRLGSLFRGIGLGRLFGGRPAFRYWERTYMLSASYGYAGGIANTFKYVERSPSPKMPLDMSALDLYGLLSDKTGKVVTLRQSAELAQALGNLEKARANYLAAAELARDLGDPTLELKCYVGLVLAGGAPSSQVEGLEGRVFTVQGRVHQKIRVELLAIVSRSKSVSSTQP